MLVSDSTSCKYAYRFLKAFLNPSMDEIHLVTAINTEGGRAAAVSRQRDLVEADLQHLVRQHVVIKEEEYTLYESLGRYVASTVQPHLILMASNSLCVNSQNAAAPSRISLLGGTSFASSTSGSGAAGGGGGGGGGLGSTGGGLGSGLGGGGLPGGLGGNLLSTSVALKILPELRCAPVLIVKYNTKGQWLNAAAATSPWSALAAASTWVSAARSASGKTLKGTGTGGGSAKQLLLGATGSSMVNPGAPTPMRVMVDLQANSRGVLEWLFEHFTAGRDHLMLTVSNAYDDKHNIKPAAQKVLTSFGVQAHVNSFRADKAMLAGPSNRSLPQAVFEAEPDVLVCHAPRMRGLPPPLVELLYAAKTSFLIWPPEYDVGNSQPGGL
ncbi:hypothetical protein HYH02_005424 [Chlamydomonas schloesseri]|uniref:UspA domain-containing protein n=1 Tax=Chlamydomonas schloesseri TaxID=2026947 RepID=A0A835WKW4_9CHLO|nr:hypothetical protein HYH02_005424 [Chlamydomonas schloesseri]|eukprot:KAG2449267.1 hypothetical protein HYH02_005424 [Chlamydomonas schloesseri]